MTNAAARTFSIAIAILATTQAPGFSAEPAAGQSLDGLSQAQLQEAFRVLSQHYIERETLDYEQLNKAALDGLLRRLNFGAELVARNGASESDASTTRYHEEIVSEGVIYLRPVTFDEKEVARAAAALRKHIKAGATTLILDLRAPVIQVEFARAAAFADLFTDRNQLLFKIRKPGDAKARLFLSKKPKLWSDRLIVLIDRDSSSVAETVAAVLRRNDDNCLLIGERTIGKAVQYEEIALNASTALRFASAQVLLPDDTSLFRKGVAPDVQSVTPAARKARIFTASHEKGMTPFVFDRERPRMNEAALVAGVNPELDYYLSKSLGQKTAFDRIPLQDRALQTALESLITIDYLELPKEKPPAKSPLGEKKPPENTGADPAEASPAGEKPPPEKKPAPEKQD